MMWLMDHIFKYTNFGIVSLIHGDFFIRQVSKEFSFFTVIARSRWSFIVNIGQNQLQYIERALVSQGALPLNLCSLKHFFQSEFEYAQAVKWWHCRYSNLYPPSHISTVQCLVKIYQAVAPFSTLLLLSHVNRQLI